MEVSGQAHGLAPMPPEPIEHEAIWVPEPVLTF